MSEPFVGEIRMVGFNFAPRGWAMCNGQLQSIAQNTALFSLLGTSFGGDGVQTFALPDMRSRTAVHQGTGPGLSPYVIGQSAGSESVTLLSSQMPQHTHLVAASAATGDVGTAANSYLASQERGAAISPYAATSDGITMAPLMISAAGGSQPFEILQPYLAVTWIIALEGIFPSRN